jgi:hypothetical protein
VVHRKYKAPQKWGASRKKRDFSIGFPLGVALFIGLIQVSKIAMNSLRQIRWILSLLFMAGMSDGDFRN